MKKVKILSLFCLFVLGCGNYIIKQQVIHLDSKLSSINREISNCEESLHLLSAEWSYLNNPERLQQLVGSQTRMVPVTGISLVGYQEIFANNNVHIRNVGARR